MVTTTQPTTEEILAGDVDYLSDEEGRQLLDRHARKDLGMSGEEFARRYRAGEIDDPCRWEVVRLSMLLPFIEP